GLRCLSCASAISDGRSMAGEGHLEAAFDELELAPTGNMGSVLNTDGGLPGRGLFDERWRNQASWCGIRPWHPLPCFKRLLTTGVEYNLADRCCMEV
ncbi:hypothetical protein HaLaN_27621, partial [Haematococcus lacustris]